MKLDIEIITGEQNAYTHYPTKYKIEIEGEKEEIVHCMEEFRDKLTEVLERVK